MIVRGHDFANIYDLVGVRIIVDTIQDCYAALGAVHARWNPVPGRFKDYIAMPKLNMYQSLHTTVVGPGGKPVEIQIRTWDMHRRAEFGIAAHWKYKENGQAGRALSSPDKSDRKRGENQELSEADNFKWIQQLADWTSETPDSNEFLGSLKEIWVLPKSTCSLQKVRSYRCLPRRHRSISLTRCIPKSATVPWAPA